MNTQNQGPVRADMQLVGIAVFGVVAVVGCVAYKKAPAIVQFWHLYKTRLSILGSVITLWALVMLLLYLWDKYQGYRADKALTGPRDRAVLLGKDDKAAEVYLHEEFRTGHAQVIGTTNAGKTESVVLPWIIQDIENGSGLLIIDGKSDRSFLEKLYAYVAQCGREKDFRLFSLADASCSSTFNPLFGGSPQEVTERVFSSFDFQDEYYRSVQYKIFLSLISLIQERKKIPTFKLVHRLLTDMEMLEEWLDDCHDGELRHHLHIFQTEDGKERERRISGLDAKLSHFSMGSLSSLFNSENPLLELNEALEKNRICYFQLPTMYYAELSRSTGKLVLQSFQSAVAKRHLGLAQKPAFFSCFLDDFQDYIYEGFGALLNKSRSANIGVVFSHQSLGDLKKVSDAFSNIVITNTNIKVVMRSNDPDTCDYLAKVFGTQKSEKATERRIKDSLGERNTGEGSVREVEEYVFHPNTIRRLERGQGVVAIPHPGGVKMQLVRFKKREDLPPVPIPEVTKPQYQVPGESENRNKATRTSGRDLGFEETDEATKGVENDGSNDSGTGSSVSLT